MRKYKFIYRDKINQLGITIAAIRKMRGIAINALANISGVSPSTIYSMLRQYNQGTMLF